MNSLPRIFVPAAIVAVALAVAVPQVRADEAADFAAVREADELRIAATISGDVAKLSAVLSENLHYAHSDGRAQTKTQLLAAVSGNRLNYLSFEPSDVKLQTIAEGAITMSGNARFAVMADGRRHDFTLCFLAVWRREAGRWRLLAWQSSQLAEAR